jgi:polyisoprenoid-binding protein YceI
MSDPITVTTTADYYRPPGWVAGTWTIDPAHTTVGFAARHLMSKVRGMFLEFGGQIVTDQDPSRSKVAVTVALSSVSTGNEIRDNHLRSGDFFNARQAPSMMFTSTDVRLDGDVWVLTGDLTIGDSTKPVKLGVEFLGVDPTGMQGEPRIGFAANGTISRTDFGISFGLADAGSKIVIGDKVDIILDVEAVLDA